MFLHLGGDAVDTGTHLVVGLGLAGLAHIVPSVAADQTVATAILIGTVIGSQAPDFDGLLRLKGNASYIKNHRGITHSLPFIPIWTIAITGGISLFFPSAPVMMLGAWVLLAVLIHVFSDLFNTYGTQAMRPFSKKWISWNIIHIFDPVIFGTHFIALCLWLLKAAEPQFIFPILYSTLVVYYVWRTAVHRWLYRRLPSIDSTYKTGDRYLLIPTVSLSHWNVVKMSNGTYLLGEMKHNRLAWIDQVSCSKHPAAEASKNHPDIAAFLSFSAYACAEVRHHSWGYEVRWIDVRYRHRKQYPFVGVVLFDFRYQPLDAYVGWLNHERIDKKLRVAEYYTD